MAIKSYQGELVGKTAPKAEEIHVEHYMNKSVVSFKTTQDILEIMDALVKMEFLVDRLFQNSTKWLGLFRKAIVSNKLPKVNIIIFRWRK